jgi:hypothetical protein
MSRSIRVSNGVTNWNVTFDPPSSPYHQYALATVVDAALVSTTGLNTFRCTYGFHFDPARTQVWQYSVSFTDGGTTNTSLEVPMTGQYNTGAAAAQALQDAVNAKEAEQAGGARVSVTVTYSEATKKFTLSYAQLRGTVNSFTIRGTIGGSGTYQRSAMSHYGNQHGADVVTSGSSGSVEFAYAVRANRFRISFAGLAGSNRLSDSVNWEARDILGFSSGLTSDVTIRASEGDTDVVTQWTITASSDAGSSISPSGAVSVNDFDDQSFTPSALAGYSGLRILVDGVSNPFASYTFTSVVADHTIEAVSFITPVATPGGFAQQVADEPRAGGRSRMPLIVPKGPGAVIMPSRTSRSFYHRDPDHVERGRMHLAGRLDTGMAFSLEQRWRSLSAEERASVVNANPSAVRAWLAGLGPLPQ